jgi:hypothetical protein
MDLLKITKELKPIKGQRLAKWLERFLIAQPDQLDKWSGHFTEVVTAKAIAIYRRRGVIEEYEVNQSRFGYLVNACYRAPVFRPEEKKTAVKNPFTKEGIETLKFPGGDFKVKNKKFFERLCFSPRGVTLLYYDGGGDGHLDLLGIKGEPKMEAIPVPVFLQITGNPLVIGGNSRRTLVKNFFLESNWFELVWRERDKWNNLSEGDGMF